MRRPRVQTHQCVASLAKRELPGHRMFRSRFIGMDVRTIYRYHAKNACQVVFEVKEELLCKLAMPRLSSGVCLQAGHASPVKWCLNEKVELLCKAGHALPVKWCLKAKVLLGKWSAIAMLELQRIRFAGWALTEGQHRPKAGKKKKTGEAGLFFLVPASF